MKAERPAAKSVAGLERLVDCGRSSVYGARRRNILRPHEPATKPGPAEKLAARAIETLNSRPGSSYGLAPRGINRVAKKADAKKAARDALAAADAASRISARCVLAWIAGALACDDLGDAPGALKRLDRAAALEPGQGWILQFRSDVRRRSGDLKGFLSDCEAAILLDEGPAYFRFAAGDERALSKERALAAANRYLAEHPKAHWMLVFRGDCRRSPGLDDFSGAAEDFERAVAVAPRCAYAWAYLSRARPDAASGLRAIDRAIELEPRCGWFRAWRGELKRRGGDAAGALKDLDRAVALDPDYELGYAWRGGARRALGRAKAALDDLDLAAALAPDHPWTLHERCLALRALGRVGEALDALEAACRLDPKLSWCPFPEGYADALAELDGVLRSEPRHFWARAWRGEIKMRMGDFAAAKADLDLALELRPGQAWALAWRGKSLWGLGRSREALRDLDRAVKADSSYSNAWAWRGRLRHELAVGA